MLIHKAHIEKWFRKFIFDEYDKGYDYMYN